MAKWQKKSGRKGNKTDRVIRPRPEPNMPTLDELVKIATKTLPYGPGTSGIRIATALADMFKSKEGRKEPLNPPEAPAYPVAQPRKMRIKP